GATSPPLGPGRRPITRRVRTLTRCPPRARPGDRPLAGSVPPGHDGPGDAWGTSRRGPVGAGAAVVVAGVRAGTRAIGQRRRAGAGRVPTDRGLTDDGAAQDRQANP